MREIRSSGSVEGAVGNHGSYSDCIAASLVLLGHKRNKLW